MLLSIRAVALRCVDLWRKGLGLWRSDFVAGAVNHELWTCGLFSGVGRNFGITNLEAFLLRDARDVNVDVWISWQGKHKHPLRSTSQTSVPIRGRHSTLQTSKCRFCGRRSMNLAVQISWQAQHFVDLAKACHADFSAGAALCKPQSAAHVCSLVCSDICSLSYLRSHNARARAVMCALSRVCVCVSHPGSKGFPRSHLSTETEAGGSPTDLTGDPTKRVKLRADIWPDQPDVPARSSQAVTPLFYF